MVSCSAFAHDRKFQCPDESLNPSIQEDSSSNKGETQFIILKEEFNKPYSNTDEEDKSTAYI